MLEWSTRSGKRSSLRGVGSKMVHSGTLVLVILLAGCSHLSGAHWPWRHKPTPPPPEVHEVVVTTEGGTSASFPQYWLRNTLLVDLQGASGSGSIVLKPREGNPWPVRLAFRVTPRGIGELEVRAEQRTVLPVTTDGSKPIVIELAPGIYTPKTAQITVSWGPIRTPAP
ncbi:MAG: hypothetical protein JWM63_1815 [Gammaproteobacteria bacterium]|jgi:hypothetical protein|nr:hypothetical protein [Gammaproteobacteria bacterium]